MHESSLARFSTVDSCFVCRKNVLPLYSTFMYCMYCTAELCSHEDSGVSIYGVTELELYRVGVPVRRIYNLCRLARESLTYVVVRKAYYS